MQTAARIDKSTTSAHLDRRVIPSRAAAPQVWGCLACGDQVAVPFLDEEDQPLATVAWPKSREEAEGMKRLPLAFMRCVNCGHVYNTKFRYDEVPYSEKPNLMFNQGAGWSTHLEFVCNLLLEYLPADPTVVEIGCGNGHLLKELARRRPDGRYIGFDPNATYATEGRVEFRGELFIPDRHLAELQPHMLVSRHVLEHLMNPLGFLQTIALAASWAGSDLRLFTEVPCIDRVFETGRFVDFYYEHNSHFTTRSFMRMLQRSGGAVEMLVHNYNREVLTGIVKFGGEDEPVDFARDAAKFRENARRAKQIIGRQLSELIERGSSVAIWGGTGKGAAFMNYFGVDADRFPVVVDSDTSKCDTFVPGTGQRIRFRDALLSTPVDVVIIPMQWRARDIVHEMAEAGISGPQILIEHQGRLIDFRNEPHPY